MSIEKKIRSKIKLDGPIALNEFLEIALFDEGQGYYQANHPSMSGGDFITAPEMSHLFAQALDEWLSSSIQSEGIKQVIELGPGSGMLAGQLMQHWKQMIDHYQLIEKSVGLKKYQQNFFSSALTEADKKRIKGYSFEMGKDRNKTKAFINKLKMHNIKVHRDKNNFFYRIKKFRSFKKIFFYFQSTF